MRRCVLSSPVFCQWLSVAPTIAVLAYRSRRSPLCLIGSRACFWGRLQEAVLHLADACFIDATCVSLDTAHVSQTERSDASRQTPRQRRGVSPTGPRGLRRLFEPR